MTVLPDPRLHAVNTGFDPSRRPRTRLSERDIERLVLATRHGSPAGRRNAAVIGVLYWAALRPSELVRLVVADFDSAAGALRVRRPSAQEAVRWVRVPAS